MSTENPKDGAKREEALAESERSELADEELHEASGGMIFVQIPGMGDQSIRTSGDGAPSSAGDRFNGKYFLQGASHAYTHN